MTKLHILVLLVLSAIMANSQCYALCLLQPSASSHQTAGEPCHQCQKHSGSTEQPQPECPHGHADLAKAELVMVKAQAAAITAGPFWAVIPTGSAYYSDLSFQKLGKAGIHFGRLPQSSPPSFSILRL